MEKVSLRELLKKDLSSKVICFPTDTVYGVGALIDDIDAINKIYLMKKRDSNKPLAILTPTKDINKYVKEVSKEAKKLMDDNWPGPLTLVFSKQHNLANEITRGLPTIAFRMPKSKIALAILNHFGMLAVTSVNFSGGKELNNINEITEVFSDYIDYIVTDEEELSKIPSMVIDVSSNKRTIIRK